MKKSRIRIITKRIIPVIILSIFLCLMVVLVVPDLFKPMRKSYLSVSLEAHKVSGISEDIVVRNIRDEAIFKRLSEMALEEEPHPPLPRVSLFPAEESEEQENTRILKNARFYHELEEIIQEEGRQREFFSAPRPQTSDVKGEDIPLPEDVVAKEFIASLRATLHEEHGNQKNNTVNTALDIRGPAASRKISYVPPPLQSKPAIDGDTLLKFWVFPDGTVGKAIPLIEEDKNVYTIAINLIKQYRFEPLPKNSPQVETWGVITVKAVLR